MAEPTFHTYEPPYLKIRVPEYGGFNDFELIMLQACMFILEHTPMSTPTRPLTQIEKARIARYLAERYAPSEPGAQP